MANWLQSTITLIRHGEPLTQGKEPSAHQQEPSAYEKQPSAHEKQPLASQSQSIFRGSTDDELSQKGWQQMQNVAETISDIDVVISSPLKRCSQFATQLATERALSLEICNELREIDFGAWEGLSIQQIESEFPDLLNRFWQNPIDNTPPDGEPVIDFQKRVVQSWNKLLQQYKGQHCLLVSHGGVQKIILSQVLNMPLEAVHNIEVPYACCSVIHVYYADNNITTTLKSHGIL